MSPTVTQNISFVIKRTQPNFVQFDRVDIVLKTSYLVHGSHLLVSVEEAGFVVRIIHKL